VPADVREPAATGPRGFNMARYLESNGASHTIARYERGATVFAQGDPCQDLRYLQAGRIRLSVVSRGGKEAVVALVAPGDFLGESCLAGHAKISQATLGEMIGATRSSVNVSMNKFRKLGLIEYTGGSPVIHNALLSIVLHE
jgi:CRP-like cAMP-binding protein